MENEKERVGTEMKIRDEERLNMIEQCEILKEKAVIQEERMEKMKDMHKEEIARMLEKREIEAEIEKSRRMRTEAQCLSQ